ncbi:MULTISPECIES: hypothetical protein [unclassified Roseobacter]|uniref:hypothetical protein n=1 Tax=unclassified Roseobacter TaxID=196798 RepID=UPI001490B828|nr:MULTISPECIES: hypothetical protein [unclassified Roseobacter]MBF9052259.1 hypothetical protein [Rhodobacterales bacterium HKCCD4356]NNV40669.1 hypothetical protein [Roseobacter sp. HKCCD9054]NNV66186.1 hypothetical protein [Roseobacter sp. HKCCD8434]NNW04499.1 hypothetical protein [Roseobacter sp. HKCCD9022]NNW34316.1 hypothetical protein [Roseobacter sp. HKCCD8198]NNW51409.1 hypothetical protein [Roseobacter sp. HKCCD9144]NNX19522.1 hypothetical protein [Roseobacter sp. HKCCD8979]NNX281
MKSLIHNPRRRGALGALVGALGPYILWAYENGVALGGDRDLILFVCGASAFFAIIGYGGFHGGFRRAKAFPEGNSPFIDFDELDKSFQSGSYAWMREVRERHW